jgi:Ring hydroxylating beta subunit
MTASWRLEMDHKLLSCYREDVLRNVNGASKVARRTIVLDANVLLDKNLSVFLLGVPNQIESTLKILSPDLMPNPRFLRPSCKLREHVQQKDFQVSRYGICTDFQRVRMTAPIT